MVGRLVCPVLSRRGRAARGSTPPPGTMKRIMTRVLVGVLVACSVMVIGAAADRAFAAHSAVKLAPGSTGFSCKSMSLNNLPDTGPWGPLGLRYDCWFKATSSSDNNLVSRMGSGLFGPSPFEQISQRFTYGGNTYNGAWDCGKNAATTVYHSRGRFQRSDGAWVGTATPAETPDNFVSFTFWQGAGCNENLPSGYVLQEPSMNYTQFCTLFTSSGCGAGTVYLSSRMCDAGLTSQGVPCYDTQGVAAFEEETLNYFEDSQAPPPDIRACDVIGIGYRVREPGSTSWVTVTPGAAWPSVDFGTLVEWTMTTAALEQIDHLVFSMIGATPLSYTGDPPNWSPGQLQPFALDLLDPAFVANDAFMSGVGIGAQWEIQPGDAQAVLIGPQTLTGTFNWWGYSGTSPAFNVECSSVGVGVTTFTHRSVAIGGSVLATAACETWKVLPWEAAAPTVNDWGFVLRKPASTTGMVSLEYRLGGVDPPASWVAVYSPPSPVTAEVVHEFSLSRATVPDPSLVEWRCTAALPGGGTTTVVQETSANTSSSSDYGRAGEDVGCYARVSSDMSLTSPKSWVTGAGKLGSCVVQWLVVPSPGYLNTKYGAFEDELETQAPFSFLFIADGFLSDLDDTVTDMEAGDAPTLPIASFTIGGATVDTSGYAPGPVVGDAVNPSDRSLLTLLLLAGVVWAVLRHAAGLLFVKSPIPDDDPTPTNFGGSGR